MDGTKLLCYEISYFAYLDVKHDAPFLQKKRNLKCKKNDSRLVGKITKI